MNVEAPPGSRLLLVDGHAFAYRSFHAIRHLVSPTGQPTNAIFGFIRAVAKLRDGLKPSHAGVVWDGGLAQERLTLLPEYKAQRPPMPPALEAQLDGMATWLGAAGIASLCRDGIEADDWIATLAVRAVAARSRVVIASSDKDFLQLVSAEIGILNPSDKSGQIWGEAEVRTKTGVAPEQVVDWLCLVGDAVDNIPGIPGIGSKTAALLLQEFQSCAQLFERIDEVKSERIRAALAAGIDVVRRNTEIIRLKTDLQVPTSLGQLELQPPDRTRLAGLYRGWGFRSLLAAVELDGGEQRVLGL